jgi:hypothetical protein
MPAVSRTPSPNAALWLLAAALTGAAAPAAAGLDVAPAGDCARARQAPSPVPAEALSLGPARHRLDPASVDAPLSATAGLPLPTIAPRATRSACDQPGSGCSAPPLPAPAAAAPPAGGITFGGPRPAGP